MISSSSEFPASYNVEKVALRPMSICLKWFSIAKPSTEASNTNPLLSQVTY